MKPQSWFGDVDFKEGVLPITKVIPMLAELIKRARKQNEHIIITQNGYSTAVLIGIESYTKMRDALKELEHQAEENSVD
jgi:prevent-host-death family protein